MKLYTTLTSPYGRMARIVMLEKGLEDRVEVIVPETRIENSPYYKINPSGRVPFLLLDDGTGLEDSTLICHYFDYVDGKPQFSAAPGLDGLEARRLDAMARSMLDGISLWSREYIYRPEEIHSQFIIGHEQARAYRLADAFEAEMDNPVMAGPLSMAQITLACTLHGRDGRPAGYDWRKGHPKLSAWVDRIGERPSVSGTLPPPRASH